MSCVALWTASSDPALVVQHDNGCWVLALEPTGKNELEEKVKVLTTNQLVMVFI